MHVLDETREPLIKLFCARNPKIIILVLAREVDAPCHGVVIEVVIKDNLSSLIAFMNWKFACNLEQREISYSVWSMLPSFCLTIIQNHILVGEYMIRDPNIW